MGKEKSSRVFSMNTGTQEVMEDVVDFLSLSCCCCPLPPAVLPEGEDGVVVVEARDLDVIFGVFFFFSETS